MTRILAAAVLCALPIAVAFGQDDPVDNYAPRMVLPKPLRAITDPKIVPASESEISDNELVIGVEIDGLSRAYPINQLTGPSREITNDELAGTAIAATW